MPSFGKGRGSCNSHEMRLSGMPGMGLLIYPSIQTYTANIGIWWVQFPCALACFGSLWKEITPFFYVGFHDTRFHDIHMSYVG